MRILVTVEHDLRRTTLSVPDDLTIEALLPPLLEECGADGSASWALLPRGGEPIEPGRTLGGAGIWQGAVLELRQTGPGEWLPPPEERRTASGLPERLTRRRRAALALAAAWGRSPERPGPASWGPAWRPFAQARATWRATDHVARLEAAIAAQPRRDGVVVAVASLEPACGRTTIALLLATVLARARGEPPLAVDTDAASRSLSRLLTPDARRRSGVALLPAPAQPSPPPEPAACASLLGRLRGEWGLTVVDCPAGFATAWGQAAWAAADQIVLVGPDRPGALAELAAVAAALGEAGVAAPVAAFGGGRHRDGAAVALPMDDAAAARLRAGALTWETAPEAWRQAVAELGATLAIRWATAGHPVR